MLRIEMDARQALFDRLERAVADGVAPGAVALVWRRGAIVYHEAHGELGREPGFGGGIPVTRETHFDLASLTKVLSTTTLVASFVGEGRLSLEAPVPTDLAPTLAGATLADLLEHASGWPAHREFFARDVVKAAMRRGLDGGRRALLVEVASTPREVERRARAIYSDLGFITLGAWLERIAGARLDALFADRVAWLAERAGRPTLAYRPLDAAPAGADALRTVAPTEIYELARHEVAPTWVPLRSADPQGQPALAAGPIAWGVVHDDNAWAMGGVAGHAGLFGTAEGVLEVARAWLDARIPGVTAALRDRFWRASSVTGSTRRLGFDGVEPTGEGSTGAAFSSGSVGHLGFTGTSLWIDPEAERIVVLLTNRVHPTRDTPGVAPIRALRRDVHALAAAIG
jgi:CubicO group peptidase (beta-lactamase class C family)